MVSTKWDMKEPFRDDAGLHKPLGTTEKANPRAESGEGAKLSLPWEVLELRCWGIKVKSQHPWCFILSPNLSKRWFHSLYLVNESNRDLGHKCILTVIDPRLSGIDVNGQNGTRKLAKTKISNIQHLWGQKTHEGTWDWVINKSKKENQPGCWMTC